MKTTTYIYSQGKTTITVSDKPALTKTEYAHACRVLRMAAQDAKSRKDAIQLLRECAIVTLLPSDVWDILVHAGQYLNGGF